MDRRSDSENVVALQRKSLIRQESGLRQGFQQVTIGSLPDEVLLMIFYFFQLVIKTQFAWNRWMKLVHICQRWRYIVFESPIRLNLQIYCTERFPVKKWLDVWPPLPLVVLLRDWDAYMQPEMVNVLAALEQRDRVRRIDITSLDQRIVTVMQKPFPALRYLSLQSFYPFGLPDTFLNGSAPSLRDLVLQRISFPSLPRLLSSTSDLTSLHLFKIPDSGYIPPEQMATSLSSLPKLKSLIINVEASLLPHHKIEEMKRRSPPPTRFVLPALTHLEFRGMSEYLEFLATRIDAPLLDGFQLTFLHWAEMGSEAEFLSDISQTIRFIGLLDSFEPSSIILEFKPREGASISFPSNQTCDSTIPSSFSINCERLGLQVGSVAWICIQILPFCSRIKSLNIKCDWDLPWFNDTQEGETEIASMLWTQLFDLFPSVQRLEIPPILESSITPVLQGRTGKSATKALPSLHSLSVVGKKPARQGIVA